MAIYHDSSKLEPGEGEVFGQLYGPADTVPLSGIYQCKGCGKEIASNFGQPFPPQNHDQHTLTQGPIIWQLIVYADHDRKLI